MLVGTAMTGQSTSPPTTLGKAPSIPATTTITSETPKRSRWRNRRCRPATPTSAISVASQPSARAVTSASCATGKSLVPAVMSVTVPTVAVGSDAGSQKLRDGTTVIIGSTRLRVEDPEERYLRQMQERKVEDSYELLTTREREVLQLLAEGRNNKEVAGILNVSLHTVETHRGNIFQKLNLHSSAELVLYAIRKGVIS